MRGKLDSTWRLCCVCEGVGNVVERELIGFSTETGNVVRLTLEHDTGTRHTWEESRLPLDDPRNVSPVANYRERITHRSVRRSEWYQG